MIWAIREQKAKYQQKCRKLISNELREPGTTFLSQHALSDFGLEERTVKRELKRIGVKTWIVLNIMMNDMIMH